ncbi:MAG: methyltransferase domain-containing protein, partial [Xanthobacteraceae bacterium]
KHLRAAVAADDLDAPCHYNLASSYQALNRPVEAATHFKKAIALGLSRKSIGDFIFLNPAVAACLQHIDDRRLLGTEIGTAPGNHQLEPIADDIFLQCTLETILCATAPLERVLTCLRSTLLDVAYSHVVHSTATADSVVRLFCALAQQCFINEYIFAETDNETRRASELLDVLQKRCADGEPIPPLLLAAVAAYVPLHSLPTARELARRTWPETVAGLVRQQILEPLQESDDANAIAALTPIESGTSLQVMRQYAENPYPRWTINPLAALAAEWKSPVASVADDAPGGIEDVLIAGCGTGQHVFHVMHNFPNARVLAIDISRPSLAYARRKTREANLPRIEFAQADILALGTIDRRFDLIEAVGVLHHLADPELGWRVLLSLLRPRGEMRIGLYSEAGRRAIAAVRAFIAEQGYRPTLADIRKCRQDILRHADHRGWIDVTRPRDFYSTSGCRDLLFNVVEHRFTIPRIKSFLDRQGLTFLGFDLEKPVLEKFQRQFPGEGALLDLDLWDRFEAENPQTFRQMYQFMVRRD